MILVDYNTSPVSWTVFFDNRISTKHGIRYFTGDNFTATLDGEHLDKQAHPYDLFNINLAPGMRNMITALV